MAALILRAGGAASVPEEARHRLRRAGLKLTADDIRIGFPCHTPTLPEATCKREVVQLLLRQGTLDRLHQLRCTGDGMISTPWPGGAAIAVSLTFNVDAEAGLLGEREQYTRRLTALSEGRFGVPEVAFDGEVAEFSCAADRFTLNYRRAFQDFADIVNARFYGAAGNGQFDATRPLEIS